MVTNPGKDTIGILAIFSTHILMSIVCAFLQRGYLNVIKKVTCIHTPMKKVNKHKNYFYKYVSHYK